MTHSVKVDPLNEEHDLLGKIRALRERLAGLSERNPAEFGELDFEAALQAVERDARSLAASRAELESLIDLSPVGMVVFDSKTGDPIRLNREAQWIIDRLDPNGRTTEELADVARVRRGGGREVAFQDYPLTRLLSSGEEVRGEEYVISTPEGRSVNVLVNATPVLSGEGEVESVVATLQDVAKLEELQRLRAEFLAKVSHELRTPLTAIKGSAATLIASGTSLDPAEALQFQRIIEEQAENMRGLITDLLDVARIEAGGLSVSAEPTEVSVLLEQARSIFLSGGGRDYIQIDLPPDLPRVSADRGRITQVLGNLLSNAARYSPGGSAIRVAAVQRDMYIEFSVADEGMGIADEQLQGLFATFSRVREADDSGEEADSGLGLAISKGIVEAHGGRIWAESDGPGLGATFSFTLPVVEEPTYVGQALSSQPGSAQSSTTRSRRTRVLVIDDDPLTLKYVREMLVKAGIEPIVAANANDLGRLIRTERPHLVLLDLVLPGADGIELMESVPELAGVPVIFLSAYGRDQVVARALEVGAEDYIVKPFSPTELLARINTAIRRRTAVEPAEPPEPYVLGDLRIDYRARRVLLAGRHVGMTDLEYRTLLELSANAGRVVSHAELLQRVWGPGHTGNAGAVRTVVKNLRRKLRDSASNPTYISNEHGVGYRMSVGEGGETDEPAE
ncbi:MAG: response regulator [Chloroflexi bacterium]|nr:response regulator [Chloroflexota bacterium]MYC00498.1 response regulator [Chloroflexota bacterium]